MRGERMNLRQYIQSLQNDRAFMENVTNWQEMPARPARYADFPDALDERIVNVLNKRGICRLYTHQRQAIDAAQRGEDVVVVTPTASGKTMCYNLPVLDSIMKDPQTRQHIEAHGIRLINYRDLARMRFGE